MQKASVASAFHTYNQLLVALKQMFLYSIQAGLPAWRSLHPPSSRSPSDLSASAP